VHAENGEGIAMVGMDDAVDCGFQFVFLHDLNNPAELGSDSIFCRKSGFLRIGGWLIGPLQSVEPSETRPNGGDGVDIVRQPAMESED
jgi:hypothetical protein